MQIQPLIIPVSESGKLYELQHDYEVDLINYIHRDIQLVIPEGFRYDGASVPRPLWSISGLSRDGLHRAAALVHDFIYHYKGDFVDESNQKDLTLTRKEADKVFRKMLKEVNIASHRCWLAYCGVRLFGGFWWNKPPAEKNKKFIVDSSNKSA